MKHCLACVIIGLFYVGVVLAFAGGLTTAKSEEDAKRNIVKKVLSIYSEESGYRKLDIDSAAWLSALDCRVFWKVEYEDRIVICKKKKGVWYYLVGRKDNGR